MVTSGAARTARRRWRQRISDGCRDGSSGSGNVIGLQPRRNGGAGGTGGVGRLTWYGGSWQRRRRRRRDREQHSDVQRFRRNVVILDRVGGPEALGGACNISDVGGAGGSAASVATGSSEGGAGHRFGLRCGAAWLARPAGQTCGWRWYRLTAAWLTLRHCGIERRRQRPRASANVDRERAGGAGSSGGASLLPAGNLEATRRRLRDAFVAGERWSC